MTTLTPFQNQLAEAIWVRLDEAQFNRQAGVLQALQDRFGAVADFFCRFFPEADAIDHVLRIMMDVTEAFEWDLLELTQEAEKIDAFEAIDAEVKAEGGTAEDADMVQNMIVQQHWLAAIAELNALATANEMPEIAELANLLKANTQLLLAAMA